MRDATKEELLGEVSSMPSMRNYIWSSLRVVSLVPRVKAGSNTSKYRSKYDCAGEDQQQL
jgi:hypothetical protein